MSFDKANIASTSSSFFFWIKYAVHVPFQSFQMYELFCSDHLSIHPSTWSLTFGHLLFQFSLFLLAINDRQYQRFPPRFASLFFLVFDCSIVFCRLLAQCFFFVDKNSFTQWILFTIGNYCVCWKSKCVGSKEKKDIHDATKFIDHSELQQWKFNCFELSYIFMLFLLIN